MVDTHLWTSIGISPSGSTIIACCKSANNIYDLYYSINNTNAFNKSNITFDVSVNTISVSNTSYVLCCTKKNIYMSSNNGINFSQIFGSLNNPNPISVTSYWSGVSISSNTGNYMVACIGGNTGGGIYLSNNYGNNWNNVLSINKNFTSISISETGKYIVACYSSTSGSNIGGIYTSSDYGNINSWSNNQTIPTNLNWSSICIKEKYSFAVACDTRGYIYTSTSNGNIWVDASLNLPSTTNFKKICISDYGYAVALSNVNMLVTANYGENWTTKTIYKDNIATIRDIGVSTNGSLVMCDISNIYTSSIYSVYNNPNKYYSTDASFVTKGLLYDQVDISNILNTSFNVNFQNPSILPNSYNIVVQNINLIDPSQNIPIEVSQTNNNYSILVPKLKENILYNIYLQSIYSNVTSVIYKQQYTKGSPINISVDIDSITDVSMNISFFNCPYIPESYSINILNQGSSIDFQQIVLKKAMVESYGQSYPIIQKIDKLSPDSKYQLSITSNYLDVSYTSIPITEILTKSAPSNISYNLKTGNVVEITYSTPSYTFPESFSLFLFNVNKNQYADSVTINSIFQSHTFTNLEINATYNVTVQSNYTNNMVIKSSPITFTNLGKPSIVCSYRFDTHPEIQKYIITTNIYLASKPIYLINFQYPSEYVSKYGIQTETFDLPTNSTNFNLYNIDVLGVYIITVTAIFTIVDEITNISSITKIYSDPFYLTIKQRPIIQFGNIDMSYNYVNIPYTIYEYNISPPKYTLYFKNTLYSLIYDQSYNIPNILTDVTCSYNTKFNIFSGTGNYSIYISDGFFYSDYINITVPETVTVVIDYARTFKSNTNNLTVYYNVLQVIPDASYTLFVNGNVSYPNISYSSSTRNPAVTQLSVDVTVIGTMNYYIINYNPDGSLYRTPSGTQIFDSKTTIDFGSIDINYNYFVIPISISTFTFRPRYNLSISGNFFTSALAINPSTIYSNNNSRFNVYANSGTYFVKLTDGITNYYPDPPFITSPTPENTLFDITYLFNTSTTINNMNNNNLSVSSYILNTFEPSYNLYLKNKDVNDLSFAISSNTSFTTTAYVTTTPLTMQITDITRSGNYSFYIKHDYTGVLNNKKSRITYISPSTDLVIDISNIVVLSCISEYTNEIIIQSNITSFNIIPLTYKLYLQSVSFPLDLSYSYNITIPTSTNYATKYKVTNQIDFSNIYVNTGDYIYYIIDSSGRKYNNNAYTYTLPLQSNTFGFIGDLSVNIFSSYNPNNNGKISTLYGISYESYKPTYTIFATNTTLPDDVTDCIYSSSIYMDNSSTIIKRSKNINYSIDVSNIYRTGIYSVYLQKNHNGNGISSDEREITPIKNIYLYLPNNVSYGTITNDISSVNIPFTITAYDISDVLYTAVIQDISFSDISYSQSFTLANNHKYYTANISNNTIYFRDLFVNTGTYSYKIFNNNGVVYTGTAGTTFTLPYISKTFYLKELSSTIFNTYSITNNGSITARYDISYITYDSIYKAVAIHTQLTDCSFSITGNKNIPASYSTINNPYSLSIPNMYRNGTYTVYLQNIYNNLANIETTSSKTIDIFLPNYIAYNNVSADCSSITLPLTVTSHDLSFVSYTIYLQNTNTNIPYDDISYNQTFIVWNNNRDYTRATTYTHTIKFNNLYANSGYYKYYVIGNGVKYDPNQSITVVNATTITLRDLSSTMFNTYSPTNIGSIIARYDISYISYKPSYKLNIIHRAVSACNYNTTVDSNTIPSINTLYDVSYSKIYRTGIYSVYIENNYTKTGSTYVDNTRTIDISVNLPNDISYPSDSLSCDISSINIQIKNICFDISNAYTVTILNNSITTDISYNALFYVNDNNIYNAPITTTKSFVFTNLFINTGDYYYYVTDWYGNKYPNTNTASNKISLPIKPNTLTLKDVTSTIYNTYSATNNGNITVTYDISYISYKPTYTLHVVSNTFTDCSYIVSITGSEIPSDYSKIQNSYTLSISSICRTSLYHVYLRNSYNNGISTEQYTRDILVNLPNNVVYQSVTADTTSIAIKFEITSFDISATDYTLYIKNANLDLGANKTFVVPYSNKYSEKNTLIVQDFSFQNLYGNTGKYYYYFTNSNGINYPSNITQNSISLINLANTIKLISLSSQTYTVYSVTNVGSISGEYQIVMKMKNPTYTLLATNKTLNDCSYSVATSPLTVDINTSYYLIIPSIYRTGIYSVQLQNKYTGGIAPEYSDSIDILVNLPNDVSYQSITTDISSITINYKITSYDISNVYTAYVKHESLGIISNASYTLMDNQNYSQPYNTSLLTLTISNLLANAGYYYYYFTNPNGSRYPAIDTNANKVSLPTATNTIALNSVSSANSDVSGSITANYSILFLTYNTQYFIINTVNTSNTQCIYSVNINSASIPTTYSAINSSYNISVSNIKRSGNYKVTMTSVYNGILTTEYTSDKYISVNITNDVSYGIDVTSNFNSITIPVKITSYDISNVTYTVNVKDVSFSTLSYTQTYTLTNNTDYTKSNSYAGNFTFSNLLANTGNYSYYITSTNDITYPTKTISLPPVTNTIVLNSVSKATTATDGSITANYSIAYLTYSPTYKLIATNMGFVMDCSYTGSITGTSIPATYVGIQNPYSNLSVSNIKRSGNYKVVLQNIYNGGSIETALDTKYISVNITNTVTYGTITSDISYINIPFTITSYDISNVSYTITVQDVSFSNLTFSQTYMVNNNAIYTNANSYTGSFTLYNLLANTGKYNYYITNTNGVTYATNTISLPPVTNTIVLNSVSKATTAIEGSITANYNISYLTHMPTYKLIATNIGFVTDCSYTVSITGTSIPNTYVGIQNPYSNLSITNIKRSGNYQVILQNTYNIKDNDKTIETSATKNILVKIPNDVSYGTVISDISSITVPFTITSYDISNVTYTVRVKNVSFNDLSANSSSFIVSNSTDYTIANIYEGSYTFTNLLANTGNYYYYITNSTGGRYPTVDTETNMISLTSVAKTITLKEVSSNILSTYSATNRGRITAKYDISYVSYAPKYKVTAVHSLASDCSYTTITTTGLPSSYTNRINPYSIDISNIYRSGIYSVYLQNISGSIEQTSSLDISVNLPNDVSFIKVTDTSYSIDISFQITTYDISLVNYDLCIQNATNPDVSYSLTYPIYPTRDYTKPTTTNIYHSVFTGLTVSGNYNYYMIDNSNNKSYTGSSIFIIGDYVPPPPVTYTATGTYTKSTYGGYTILKYTSGNGTFTPTNANVKIGYLVVGGGSAGNPWGLNEITNTGYYQDKRVGGAGGNGGAIAYSLLNLSNITINQNITYNITVGSGSTTNTSAGNPSNIDNIVVAQGGTKTVIYTNNTKNGNTNTATASGGINNINGNNGASGGDHISSASTANGTLISIEDININSYYGGGGGGGGRGSSADNGGNGGNGGTDGKGGKSYGSSKPGEPGNIGTANYGGGGGGGGAYYDAGTISNSPGSNGGNGGSGVVIIYFNTYNPEL